MSVEGWFVSEELVVDPGTRVTLPLTIHQLGNGTDSFTILPSGLNAAWISVGVGNLTLFAGSRETIPVTVAPPALPTTSAGPTVVSVRITSDSDPDVSMVAETTIGISPFDDRRIVPLQPVMRARRRSTFEFMVENHGNALASCRLRLIDPSNRIDGDFDPPAVGVAPGGSSLVQLRARARGQRWRRRQRILDFDVEAEQPGHAPADARFALMQSPTISGGTVGRAAAVVAAAALVVGGWLGVVKPAIDDSVERQVAEQVAAVVPDPDDAAATPDPADLIEAEPEVEPTPLFERLAVNARIGSTADETYTVADDVVFDVTDLRVENPFGDDGVATLLINAEPMFVWSLANIRANVFEPRITPMRLQPGDAVTFSVRCDNPADGATCASTAALIGGTTLPADR